MIGGRIDIGLGWLGKRSDRMPNDVAVGEGLSAVRVEDWSAKLGVSVLE